MRRSAPKRSRSTSRSSRRAVDVYLFPAIVGGGLGDIAEVLDAGRVLADDGHRLFLFRSAGSPLPRSVEGPWTWPPHRRIDRPARRGTRAITIAPTWGVSASPGGDGALGRPGPWAREAAAVERAYGADETLHVSLEEFARDFSVRREYHERFREGGAPARSSRRSVRSAAGRRDEETWRRAFRLHRQLDRPNLLHVLAGFDATSPIAREFPELVATGPLWPPERGRGTSNDSPRVVWYASPASSDRIAPSVVAGLERAGRRCELLVRTPRPLQLRSEPTVRVRSEGPIRGRQWSTQFASARLRIVTGSRTLLEAIRLGGPFLYFNGVLVGRTGAPRRHRPEKIEALVRQYRRRGIAPRVIEDLAAFSRGLRVAEIVERAVSDPTWRRGFPSWRGFSRGLPRDAGSVLRSVGRRFALERESSTELVRSLRGRDFLALR